MLGVSDIARSGMLAADARVSASAQNVANLNTDGYVASRVTAQPARDGGVTFRSTPSETSSPMYGRDGRPVGPSTIDVAQEIVAQLGGAEAFQANLAVVSVDDSAMRSVLDLKL